MPQITRQPGRVYFARRRMYRNGFEYGSKCAARMTPIRRRDNELMVRDSDYFAPSSLTRAYWLGFVRAMRDA